MSPASSQDEQRLLPCGVPTPKERQRGPVPGLPDPAPEPLGQPALLFQLVRARADSGRKRFGSGLPWKRVVGGVSRLLKACGSRLTEKLLEGAPTEDTLVLIEKQTGSHAALNHTNS